MTIFGVLVWGNSLKLNEIPPVPGCITHKIEEYIPWVHAKVSTVDFQLVCTHRWRVNLKKWRFLGFWYEETASNWMKSPLYQGKRCFFAVFYLFPTNSESGSKFQKIWWDGVSPPGQVGFHLSQLFSKIKFHFIWVNFSENVTIFFDRKVGKGPSLKFQLQPSWSIWILWV